MEQNGSASPMLLPIRAGQMPGYKSALAKEPSANIRNFPAVATWNRIWLPLQMSAMEKVPQRE